MFIKILTLIDEKKQLRKELIIKRGSISDKVNRSLLICSILTSNKSLKESKNILLYHPTLDEVDIIPVIEFCWSEKKNVFFPFIKKRIIGHVRNFGNLKDFNNKFKEPIKQVKNNQPPMIDLIIIPGLGFDKKGYRLGLGRGWYDRYISALKKKPILIGVCFKEQIKEIIPREDHDIKVDEIISA